MSPRHHRSVVRTYASWMPSNEFRVQGERLGRSLDEFIRREFPDRADQAQVRRGVVDYFRARTASVESPRRPFPPGESPAEELPGDWN